MKPVGYVITATRDDGTKHYMGIDRASGGYEYWTGLEGAKIYPSEGDATAAFVSHNDGKTFVHRATDASYAKPNRYVDIGIEQLLSRSLATRRLTFSIKAPT